MKRALTQKIVPITNPGAIVDNAPFNTASVATKGWGHVTIVVLLGALDIALAALKLRESNDDAVYTDVSGADFSVAPAALPGATADNNLYAIQVDLRGRKRFLDLTMTGGDGATGTYASAFAILSRGSEAPDSATERGFAAELSV